MTVFTSPYHSIVLMSKLEALGETQEKENVCHLSVMVMEAGISLSTVAE